MNFNMILWSSLPSSCHSVPILCLCHAHAIFIRFLTKLSCLRCHAARAERSEASEALRRYEAYRMVNVMFKLCSFHASSLHSKFTILSALPVQMLSQVPRNGDSAAEVLTFWVPFRTPQNDPQATPPADPQMDVKMIDFR